MKPIKQHITFVLALLMAYAPIHNIVHYVWIDHDHHHHHNTNTIDDEVTTYEVHHNCSDFLYQLTSLTSIIVLSIEDIAGLIYFKTLGNNIAIVLGLHLLSNALRGPPNPISNV